MKKKEKKRAFGLGFKAEIEASKSLVYKDNEITANKDIAKSAIGLGTVMSAILLAFVVYIFVTTERELLKNYILMFTLYPIVTIIMFSTKFWAKTEKIKDSKFKTFLLLEFIVMTGVINIIFPRSGAMCWPLVLVLAAQYYSPIFTRKAYSFTIAAMLVCLYLGLIFGEWDANLLGAGGMITIPGIEEPIPQASVTLPQRWAYLMAHPNLFYEIIFNTFFASAGALTIFYLLIRLLCSRTFEVLQVREKESANKERIENEMNYAKGIQAGVLPGLFPNTPKGEVYALMNTAKEVGGDFYDYFYIDENHLALTIADVSGKGVPAALYMMKTESLIKALAMSQKTDDPSKVLYAVNKGLCEGNVLNMFVTCWFGIFDFTTGKLNWASAGHNPPIICKEGHCDWLKGKVGFVLGGMDTMKYVMNEVTLVKGDKLFLYTDGVTEAHNNEKQLYSEPRLLDLLSNISAKNPREVIEAVRKDIDVFADGAEQFDDITMLAMEYRGSENTTTVKKTFVAKTEENDEVMDFIHEVLSSWNVDKKLITSFKICAEEIFVNIASYAYEGQSGSADVEISKEDNNIFLSFADQGVEFNPLAKTDPNVAASVEERGIGGLGIFMVKKMMDQVTYRRVKGANILTLKKSME